jgi:molybdopterin synthase catalytic subunit
VSFGIVDRPIDVRALEAEVLSEYDGAVCTFQGVARRFSRGREVVHLEYEAYPEMAERKMAEIGDEVRARFGIERVAIRHRIGVLEIGEASVAIAVASPHRREAFAACRYAIDRLKQTVPIWKKEVWSDGEQWVGWENEPSSIKSRVASSDGEA